MCDYLFEDIKKEIENQFIKNGWVLLYATTSTFKDVKQGSLYSTLIKNRRLKISKKNFDWELHYGSGKPGFVFSWKNDKQIGKYFRFLDVGIEPLIYYRNFNGIKDNYFDVSEEFRLYFDLYEEFTSHTNKKYINIDDDGEEEDVIIVTKEIIKCKLKYIKEYLAVKKMTLVIQFDLMRFSEKSIDELQLVPMDRNYKKDIYHCNHFIRDVSDMLLGDEKTQSWFMGKVFIKGQAKFKPPLFSDKNDEDYAEFIIGYNVDGEPKYYTCNEEKLSNYFGKNPGCPHFLTPVYFNREALGKYYGNTQKYDVKDGRIECKGLWSLRLDNDNPEYIVVFLGDLGRLSSKEQLYWKSFNIPPKSGISRTSWKRGFEAEFCDPENPELLFKQRYELFLENSKKILNWYFLKPLADKDVHHLKSLHIPFSNNQSEFDAQVLSLTKILIDSLNEKELSRGIEINTESPKGIDKLEGYLIHHAHQVPEMIKFLRHLQDLRSKTVAHRKSNKSNKTKKIYEYFEIDEKPLQEVLESILVKSIMTVNTFDDIIKNVV